MEAKSVERLKQKVEKLITTFQTQSAQIESLEEENYSLKQQVRDLSSGANAAKNTQADLESLKKKVDVLIEEVDNCIELANA